MKADYTSSPGKFQYRGLPNRAFSGFRLLPTREATLRASFGYHLTGFEQVGVQKGVLVWPYPALPYPVLPSSASAAVLTSGVSIDGISLASLTQAV